MQDHKPENKYLTTELITEKEEPGKGEEDSLRERKADKRVLEETTVMAMLL